MYKCSGLTKGENKNGTGKNGSLALAVCNERDGLQSLTINGKINGKIDWRSADARFIINQQPELEGEL